jgi:signal peptidase II
LIAERGNGHRNLWKRWFVFASIAIGGALTDIWTKDWIFGWLGLPEQSPPFWIVEGFFGFETTVNPGALGGFGAGWGIAFASLAFVAIVGILVWLSRYRGIESRWLLVALGCVMAGILGNLYDRLGFWNPPPEIPQWKSSVRDWILFRVGDFTWPNFNIADSLLVCGAIMLALHSFFWAPSPEAADKFHKSVDSR